MKEVHVECKPDELLISKLGFTKKKIIHHTGKSRVFHALKSKRDLLAMVDEDPNSAKSKFEKSLSFQEEVNGIKYYRDGNGNKIFILSDKLEDWIIGACKKHRVDIKRFGLPDKANDLHDVINHRLHNFSRLVDELIIEENPALLQLKAWLD